MAPMGRRRPVDRARSFEAAQTDRLNSLHWSQAQDTPVNTLLATYLGILRARAAHEALNNPNVEGVIKTHADDVIGEEGPTLQVQSNNEAYNRELEGLWAEWWAEPDIAGQLSGPDLLKLHIRLDWVCGEDLTQIVTDPDAAGPVQMRLRLIHPRRMYTPLNQIAEESIALGVRRNRIGRPLGYFVETALEGQSLRSLALVPAEIPAANILHDFHVIEPDQARGVPWLTSSLSSIADLRDYDAEVMDAARAAADLAVLLYTRNPDAQFVQVEESAEIERRMITTCPPGYEAMQVTPQQPASTYRDFRAERLRELGRPVGMPLMAVQLDSRQHNYSSARFDSQVYQRGVRSLQRHKARKVLRRLLDLLAREGELAQVLPRRPQRVTYRWTWAPFPHVDPAKEADAVGTRLKIGISTLRDECAADNKDWEEVLAQQARERERMKGLGLNGGQGQGDAGRMMESLARAVRSGMRITEAEARTCLGLSSEPTAGQNTLRFSDENVLAYHIESGVLTINEVRARLKLPAVDWGDAPVRRQGFSVVTPAGPRGEENQPPAEVSAGTAPGEEVDDDAQQTETP